MKTFREHWHNDIYHRDGLLHKLLAGSKKLTD